MNLENHSPDPPLRWIAVFACLCCGGELLAEESPAPPAAAPIDFARQVQPILAKRCFSCHGPDEAESGLRFHEESSAFGEAESGERAIVPGASKRAS